MEAADAAIKLDPSWAKGHYFRALALEDGVQLDRALAACEEGLSILGYVQKRLGGVCVCVWTEAAGIT